MKKFSQMMDFPSFQLLFHLGTMYNKFVCKGFSDLDLPFIVSEQAGNRKKFFLHSHPAMTVLHL